MDVSAWSEDGGKGSVVLTCDRRKQDGDHAQEYICTGHCQVSRRAAVLVVGYSVKLKRGRPDASR
jgi:hypothetical protein